MAQEGSAPQLRKRRRWTPSGIPAARVILHPCVLLLVLYLPANGFSPFSLLKLHAVDPSPSASVARLFPIDSTRRSPDFRTGFALRTSTRRKIPSCLPGTNSTTRLAASVAPSSSDQSTSSGPPDKITRKRSPEVLKRHRIRKIFHKARVLERKGLWRKAADLLRVILDLDPVDAHTHLALARLEARRFPNSSRATDAFINGTTLCPDSIHLWQAWAIHEQVSGRIDRARQLFERALDIDPYNPYVCHAYGLMEHKEQRNATAGADCVDDGDDDQKSRTLWERALQKNSTAALVCSLGEWFIARREYAQARDLYTTHVLNLSSHREQTEVYLAAAWLEERYFSNFDQAAELIQRSLALSPTSSMAKVALARLESRRQRRTNQDTLDKKVREATARRLENACIELEQQNETVSSYDTDEEAESEDGRVFNAWANIEVKARRFSSARKILQRGLRRYPNDFSLMQAAGKVEERMGNYTGARCLYSKSLYLQPSAPSLVAFALLELRRPESGTFNFTQVKRMFEEALLLDPRHGPAYNAYARCVFEREGDEAQARSIFERGVRAKCPDAASLYHGYAKLELSVGNVNRARKLLLIGRREAKRKDIWTDSPHRERALFLSHTLGMLELNSNRPSEALSVFVDGLERYGNSSQLLLGAALCEVKLGNAEKARHLFQRSVLSDDKHAHAWQAWGVMEMRAGNFNTAKTLFRCGIKSAPNHGPLWQAFALMESRRGHVEEARSLFKDGIKNAPNHISLYQGWASVELREGNFGPARALITEALTRDKRHGAGWLIAAEIEKQLGNNGLAKLLLRRGIECAPTNPALYNALGDSLSRERKINEAREIYEKGIEVDPHYAQLYHSLAELEAQVFNVEGLSRLNKRAAAVFNTNALEPPASSSEVWGSKIKANRNRSVPREVAALADRIAEDDGEDVSLEGSDPTSFLDGLSANVLEEGLISHLLNMDDQELGRDN